MDVLTPEQRKRNMQAIKPSNTKLELTLGKALWKIGFRYRKNDKTVFGKPDFVFKKKKIAVFCDSEFWHGKDWHTSTPTIQSNRDFWITKIEKNIARDVKVNTVLKNDGWLVLRFWGEEIQKSLDRCVETIQRIYNSRIIE